MFIQHMYLMYDELSGNMRVVGCTYRSHVDNCKGKRDMQEGRKGRQQALNGSQSGKQEQRQYGAGLGSAHS